ncbi:homoserine O-acetyltransferase [uncultured Porticoccus sp.]|uniref:homoserine O-succinyltransferase MetX n=1 Tax=uncultured Porticoccus sp. TaxID=1256050 RepID=UPI0026257B21|nr:homoserine O-acetyltransferase [uncultured Porticoccus sp.]
MPDVIPENSVGIVTPQAIHFDEPLVLACGRTLDNYTLMVETYGELNADGSNAILICHALSGHHHAAGYHSMADQRPGWWDNHIGPGKPFDTNRFFIVCPNNIGGCHGSTGPISINPDTDQPWGPDFPPLRVRDWVESQARLADKLGIRQWAAIVGGSLGGMQVMRWALEYPDRVRHAVVIASAMKLSAQNIAFNEIARNAIRSDPEFCNGRYLEQQTQPRNGLGLARMIGHVTYLSDELMGNKFGRELRSGSFQRGQDAPIEFQVESYLRHQGDAFSGTFDANTYLLMTKALDYFDLAREYDHNPVEAFRHASCNFLVVSFSSDWRFSPERAAEIVEALIAADKNVAYTAIESNLGHDAFLLPNQRYEQVLTAYINRIAAEISSK